MRAKKNGLKAIEMNMMQKKNILLMLYQRNTIHFKGHMNKFFYRFFFLLLNGIQTTV